MGNEVVEADKMVKRVRPEVGLQIRAGKHSAKGIPNRLVRTFARAILVRRVGTSQFNRVPEVRERLMDVAAFTEFTSSVHANILVGVRTGRRGGPPFHDIG